MKLAILGEFDPRFEPHVQTNEAIGHSAAALALTVEPVWISTSELRTSELTTFDALWIAPGSPYRDLARALDAIRYARESLIPCLGTCGGFQHMVIEYARHVVGISDAQHAEYDPYASNLIVSKLSCSLVGREFDIALSPNSKAAEAYGSLGVRERYYCNFGLNSAFVGRLTAAGLRVVGGDAEGECRVIELSSHPFFIGTLFVPQARSTAEQPHPLINAFLAAASRLGVAATLCVFLSLAGCSPEHPPRAGIEASEGAEGTAAEAVASPLLSFGVPDDFSGRLTEAQEKDVPAALHGAFHVESLRPITSREFAEALKVKTLVAEERRDGGRLVAIRDYRCVHFSDSASGLMIVIERFYLPPE